MLARSVDPLRPSGLRWKMIPSEYRPSRNPNGGRCPAGLRPSKIQGFQVAEHPTFANRW